MTRREIFQIISLVCLGIFLLLGAYLWRYSISSAKASEYNLNSQNKQSENVQMANNNSSVNSVNSKEKTTTAASSKVNVPEQSTSPAPAANSVPTASSPAPVANSVPTTSSSTPAPSIINNLIIPQEFKVGEFVKLGGLEMIVTKSTTRHKVIDITLKGNDTNQAPILILNEKNHIIYEIPYDTDVNMDVSEKVVVDKSPVFNTP